MNDNISRLASSLTGRYEIERELGSGGMATVYLAKDVRHDRDVAIKVLHPDLGAALGSERFLSEIKTTAKLQHPHILPLLDSGDADGLLYYVMPYVTGETLRQRLEREQQLPINAAITIAKEVADALSAAHEMGIVHRDIKPENILLRGNHALVADFGIALAVQQAGGARMTQTGLSLGTPQYMSPEQAMGDRNIGPRSDIYSLGAVTYEMLGGEPPFTGHSVQAIVAKVMTERPVPLSTLRNTVSPAVEDAVLTALAKLPADRFATASEFATALGSETSSRTVAIHPTTATSGRDRKRLQFAVAAFGLATLALLAIVALKPGAHDDAFPYRMEITSPSEQIQGAASISPDGHSLAFVGKDPVTQLQVLYLRRLDQLTSRIIPGATKAQGPVFSPDGKSVAYVAGRKKIMKVALDGGTPVTLGDVDDYGGLSWSKSGDIVAGAGSDELQHGLSRVSSDGGPQTQLTKVDSASNELSHQHPVVLGDGKTVLFTVWYGNIAKAQIAATHLGDGKVTKVGVAGTRAIGVVDGQIIYMRADGVLAAAPFDIKSLKVTGNERAVEDAMTSENPGNGAGFAFLSGSGALVYPRGVNDRRLVWVNQKGDVTPAVGGVRGYINDRVSPDGKRAAICIATGLKIDLWILDFESGTLAPITSDGGARNAVWTGDGRQIYNVSTRGGRAAFWLMNADGSSEPKLVGQAKHNNAWNIDLSPDGHTIVFNAIYNGTFNLETYSLDSSHSESEVTALPAATETNGRFSPDGKWVAYQSDESGRMEVYLRAYPSNSDKTQISSDGGVKPIWSSGGDRIYFQSNRKTMMATIAKGPSPRVVSRQTLFEGDYAQEYDVAPDGRLLMLQTLPSSAELIVIPNWAAELRARTH
jgi:Tol biopolymer transport system component